MTTDKSSKTLYHTIDRIRASIINGADMDTPLLLLVFMLVQGEKAGWFRHKASSH
jgi:hypothetical protein